MPFYHLDEVDGDGTNRAYPAGIEYRGMMYRYG